jgi:hypothetical protein
MASLNKLSALLSLLGCIATAPATAQHLTGAAGMVNAGLISTRWVDRSVEKYVPDSVQFGKRYTLVGIEGYHRNGRAIVSFSGYLGAQENLVSGSKLYESSIWNAHVGFGWVISQNTHFVIYPSAGFGVSGFSLTEYQLQGPTKQIDLAHKRIPSADVSVHFDYFILEERQDKRAVNGIVLGLKAGYNTGMSSTTQIHGWYTSISVGGLSFMREKP